MGSQRGLTTLELALAVALLLTLMGVAYQAVTLTDRAATRSQAYRVAGALRAVRQEAIARQQTCWLRLEPGDAPAQFWPECAGAPVGPREEFGAGVRVNAQGTAGLAYGPAGLTGEPGVQILYLTPRSGGPTWSVTLSGYTGEVVVARGQ